MSRSAYWYLESGKNFEIKSLLKIYKLLEITLAEFFEPIDLPKINKTKIKNSFNYSLINFEL